VESQELSASYGGFAQGSAVGRYLLEEQIGHGGMAAVFRARDEQLGRTVALKILAPGLAADEAFRHRFVRESRAAAAVDDPHIIPLYEAGEANGVLFIAMRFVPGGDVRSLLFREGPLAAERAVAIVSPVAAALDAAHAAGLVHRDIKPANMLLDSQPGRPDHVYLSDFGLSKAAAGSTGLTGTGLFLGTVDYAAPEQINGQPVDGRADQYSLGCAAFEMLGGEPPFQRDHGMAVLAAHLSQPVPRLTVKRPDLPPAVDEVFARVLAKRAADRYQSCQEFADALRDALRLDYRVPAPAASHPATELAIAPFRPEVLRADTRPSRRPAARWPIAATAAIVGIAVASVAVALALRPSPARQPGHDAGHSPAGPARASGRPAAERQPNWTRYRDRGEFSISLPPGWTQQSTTSDEVKFSGALPGFVIVVEWTTDPQPDALTDWQNQATSKAAADSSYRLISIRRVFYRGYNAADWSFVDDYPAQLDQFLDRGFIVRPGQLGFAIELYGPLGQFHSVHRRLWHRLVASFEPAS
jgi:Protein kinase domain